ncbi:MAG: cation:dicarboxylase symporter family transporter [Spirochaetia bacterium]|jgi:Na+/H+-dicarboxylate symporter|nr:cation:dicarboxylase symporter family transporter [Spirochaetia bacterium]
MMKIWLKYLIATLVGLLAGLVIPAGDGSLLSSVAGIVMNMGQYTLLPLIFFSVAIAAFELHEEKRLHRVWLKTAGYSLVMVFALSLIGLAGAFLFSPGRIPLSSETNANVGTVPSFLAILSSLFTQDAFSTLLSFDFILPASLFALILGVAFAYDKSTTKPAVSFFDSLSRILWQINSFFVEFLPLPLIVASMARVVSINKTPRLSVFGPLFGALGFETAIVVLILLPLALWLLDRKKNPYKTIFALIAPAIAGLVSGNSYIQAGVAAKHLKESLGVRRRAGAVSLPISLSVGRAGTAMVTATAFVTILNSYSNLGLGSSAILWMILSVPVTALLLGAAPGSGPIVALTALCASYGRGFESGYILLVPIALPLAMIAAFIDGISMSAVVATVASSEGYVQPKDIRHFI